MPWWNLRKTKGSLDQKLESELRFHLDKVIEEKIASGMAADEARRQAIVEFGGPQQVKEELRDIHRLPVLDATAANLRFAVRLMRKSPSFSIAVIITLALGIGANSAVFSAINAILLRPLPFPDSEQLVLLRQFDTTAKAPASFVAPTRLEDWNRLNSTFQDISGYYTEDISDLTGSIPEKVTEADVAPRFFQIWGIAPTLGRDFNSSEERFGGPQSVIISHRYWLHRFNGDSAIIGRKLRLEHSSYTVVGVMPANFRFQDANVDIWWPSPPDAPWSQRREDTWYNVFGRMKPGVTLDQARANLATVQSQLGREYPKTDLNVRIDVESLKDLTTEGSRQSLWILFGAVSLLLVIACTNIAALLLARATQREREISVRLSLGASRGTIILQLLTESFVLAVIGSVLGLFVAAGGATLFRRFATGFPRTGEVTLDMRIVIYTFVCAVAATILCGLIPAIRITRQNTAYELAHSGRALVSSRNPLQWVLVGVQVALAVTLLAGSGLMLRSFQELGRISPGFETSRILTFRISGNWGETTDMKALTRRIDRSLEGIRAMPGVRAAATAAALPGVAGDARTDVILSEASNVKQGKLAAESRFVSDGYFATMQIPILAGDPCHTSAGSTAVLINRSFANSYMNGVQPLGRHLELALESEIPKATIIGITADAREQGVNHAPLPTVYWCTSAPFPTPYFLIRTQGAPMAMAETLRQKIHALEPARSVFGISPLEQHLSDSFSQTRLRTVLLTAFALTAVALACTGLYGTLSYFVTVRRREVGLRLALGAMRGQIIGRFLMKGVVVSMIGCVAGLCIAIAFSHAIAGMLFGVTPTDAATMLGVTGTVLMVAASASFIPATRAAGVDPMEVLREE